MADRAVEKNPGHFAQPHDPSIVRIRAERAEPHQVPGGKEVKLDLSDLSSWAPSAGGDKFH